VVLGELVSVKTTGAPVALAALAGKVVQEPAAKLVLVCT
jgi:hypothetical protein